MEAFIVWPSMPMLVTNATPKVRAKAVAAVRRGLRRELVAASLPMDPKGAPIALPSVGTSGKESAGPAKKKPIITPTAPRPTRMARTFVSASLSTPANAAIMPPIMRIAPKIVRTFSEEPEADSVVRIASTGSTAPARRAGAHAETTVTIVPKMIGTTTAETLRPRPPPMSIPLAPITALITATNPTPATTPTMDPRTPTMTDSTTTELVIWRRDAPKARKSANSLMRWATIMENVLAIIKVPTNKAIRPKATRK